MPTSTSETEPTMKASQLLKIIPEFHGRTNENVHEFLDAADESFSLVIETEKKILLTFLRTKLKGAAFKAIQYMRCDSWDELKSHLSQRFGVGDTIRFIEKEFTMLVQKPHESVAEFGERTCTLAAKITEYNIREKKYDAEMFQKIMEDRILVQFITGLRELVRFQVKAYKITEYREALAVACNLEKEAEANKEFDSRNFLRKIGLKDQGSYHEKPKCHVCKKTGHKASDCFFNRDKKTARVNVVTCYFCNKLGHIAKDCRTRTRQLSNDTNRSQYNNKSESRPLQPQPQASGNEFRLPLESRKGRPANQYK